MDVLVGHLGHNLDSILYHLCPRDLSYFAKTSKSNFYKVKGYIKRVHQIWSERGDNLEIDYDPKKREFALIKANIIKKCMMILTYKICSNPKSVLLQIKTIYPNIKNSYSKSRLLIYGLVLGGNDYMLMQDGTVEKEKRANAPLIFYPYPKYFKIRCDDKENINIKLIPYQI